MAFYGEFFYWPHKNIGFYLGAGIHSYNYHAEFEIPDPEMEGDFLFDEYRKLQAVAWSPVLGMTFKAKKFMSKIGVVAFDPTDVKTSAESNAATHLFFSSNQTNAVKVLYIKEDISFVGEPDAFKMIQASVHYEISKNFFMHAGIEFTIDKFSTYHYRLYIKEYPPDDPTMSTVANDFRITTNYTAVTLGMSYNLGFGKFKQRTNE